MSAHLLTVLKYEPGPETVQDLGGNCYPARPSPWPCR